MCYIIGNDNVIIVFSVCNSIKIRGKIYVAMTRCVLYIKLYKLCLIVIKESCYFTIVTAF